MQRNILLTLSLLLLGGCFLKTTKKTTEEIVEGLYTWGPEVSVLHLFDSEKTYWVVGSKPLLSELRRTYKKITTEPYESVYVILKGARHHKATQGYAASYDGTFDVTKIFSICPQFQRDCDYGK